MRANSRARDALKRLVTPALLAVAPWIFAADGGVNAVQPTAYDLAFTIQPAMQRFSGRTRISLDVGSSTSVIALNGRKLDVSRVVAIGSAGRIDGAYSEDGTGGKARVVFATPLPVGKTVLEIDYTAPLQEHAQGLYHAQVDGQWYAWTQFESSAARSAFPSFDAPGYKTPFTVSVATDSGNEVIGNAPQTSVTRNGDLSIHQFATTKPLPTYLVALAVGPFVHQSAQIPPNAQRPTALDLGVWAPRPKARDIPYALGETGSFLSRIEAYVGRPYPFEKLDEIASPLMNGAMENPGAIIYNDDALLPGAAATVRQQQIFGTTVAHELAHQWFGNLVTPRKWNDLWLNESFADWMGYRIADEWKPGLHAGMGLIADGLSAMRDDEVLSVHAIRPADRDGDTPYFDSIVYGKGGMVLGMIAAYMGDPGFQVGLRLYFDRYAYANAGTEDFFKALADAAGDPKITDALASFVTQPGIPVLRLDRVHEGYRITQARYQHLGAALPAQHWTVPVCLRDTRARSCLMLTEQPRTVASAGALLTANAGGAGYYRFSLADDEWVSVLKRSADLSAAEALSVDDSLWADFAAGRTHPGLLFDGMRAMAGHPYSGANVDGGLRMQRLRWKGFVPEADLARYRALVRATYRPLLDRAGLRADADPRDAQDPDREQLRVKLIRLLLVEGGDPAVRATLAAAAQAALDGHANALSSDLLIDGYNAWLQVDPAARMPALLDKISASNDATFRQVAAYALGTEDSRQQGAYLLDRLTDPRLRLTFNDRLPILRGLAQDPATRPLALDWVGANFDLLLKDASSGWRSVIPGIFSFACSTGELKTMETRLRPHVANDADSASALDQAEEQVRDCALLHERRGADFSSALHRATH